MKKEVSKTLHEALKEGKKLGVIGSPSSSILLSIDVAQEAYDNPLVGHFCIAETRQQGSNMFPLGQVVSIKLSNPYIERHSIRKVISVRGQADPLTEQHDIRLVEMAVGSCFSDEDGKITPSNLANVPSSGTPVYILNKAMVEAITAPIADGVSYLGKMYNTDIELPMSFRHYGKGSQGLGEAYHIGIFGKTGSGKSYLARMIIGCYSKHKEMSVLVIDPQGEYAKEVKSGGTLSTILSSLGRTCEVIDISKLALTTLSSLEKVIKSSTFLNELSVRTEANQQYALEQISEFFQNTKPTVSVTGEKIDYTLQNAHRKEVFNKLLDYLKKNIQKIYVSAEPQNRVVDKIDNWRDELYKKWLPISNLYSTNSKTKVDDIFHRVVLHKSVTIIDLTEEAPPDLLWNSKVQAIAIEEIARSLYERGSVLYRQGESFNLLVAIDEAHRLIPREEPSDEYSKGLKQTLIDSIRTTRKYGLGWMFISQSLASLDQEILRQLRLYFFGYGLSWGSEYRVLESLVGGGDYISLYQSLKDPQTSALFGKKEYPFMVYGPVSPLSSSGTPMFFTALNYSAEYLVANNLVITPQ